MAVAAVSVDRLERGDLPLICAKTGVPCEVFVKDRLRVVPRWVPPLAVLLIVPYFVARTYTARNLNVELPIAPARQNRIRLLVRGAWIALVISLAGLSASFFGGGAPSALVFLAGLLVYLAVVYAGDQMWVGARPGTDADNVVLTRVHPNFVRALDY